MRISATLIQLSNSMECVEFQTCTRLARDISLAGLVEIENYTPSLKIVRGDLYSAVKGIQAKLIMY